MDARSYEPMDHLHAVQTGEVERSLEPEPKATQEQLPSRWQLIFLGLTIIIKFDEQSKVRDFAYRTSQF